MLITPLDDLTVIRLEGERSRDLLQGQLSCDVREVTPTQMRQGALCDLKGRVLALIDVVELDTLHLVLPRALAGIVMKNLQKPAMLARVTLQECTALQLLGVFVENQSIDMPSARYAVTSRPEGCCYGLTPQLSIWMVTPEYAAQFLCPAQVRGCCEPEPTRRRAGPCRSSRTRLSARFGQRAVSD